MKEREREGDRDNVSEGEKGRKKVKSLARET